MPQKMRRRKSVTLSRKAHLKELARKKERRADNDDPDYVPEAAPPEDDDDL